jgi:hypothetical protein
LGLDEPPVVVDLVPALPCRHLDLDPDFHGTVWQSQLEDQVDDPGSDLRDLSQRDDLGDLIGAVDEGKTLEQERDSTGSGSDRMQAASTLVVKFSVASISLERA